MSAQINRRQLEQLASSIGSLRSGKYSDFSIRCSDDTVIQAHRAVVCPRSRVLSAAIDGKFQEAISQEIYLGDDEPGIVAKMMDFLYTLDYDDGRSVAVKKDTTTPNDAECNPISLSINANVFIIADKYDISDLKELAGQKYMEVLPTTWRTLAFTESARLVYANTMEADRILRDAIVKIASDNIRALYCRDDFVDLLKTNGDLATDIMRQVINKDDVTAEAKEPDVGEDDWANWGRLTTGKKKKSRLY